MWAALSRCLFLGVTKGRGRGIKYLTSGGSNSKQSEVLRLRESCYLIWDVGYNKEHCKDWGKLRLHKGGGYRDN